MKKMFKYVPVILGLIMVMSSCGDDDETEPAAAVSVPSVSYSVDGSSNMSTYNLTTSTSGVTIAVTVQKTGTGKDIDKISISQSGVNVTTGFVLNTSTETYDFSSGTDVTIKNADDESFVGTGTFAIRGNVGTTTYTIKATDNDGVSTTKSFSIVVAAPTTPFTETKTGVIYNINGSLLGTWNLAEDTSTTASTVPSAGEVFMRNTNVAPNAFTGAFTILPTSSNLVVAAAGFDYANATVTSAETAYNAGTAVSSITAPAVGDVYIVNGGSGNFAAVKIMSIDPNDNTCNCGNKGKMTFEYKK